MPSTKYRQYYQDGSAARNMYTAAPVPEEFFEEEPEVKAQRERHKARERSVALRKARAKAAKKKKVILTWVCLGVAAVVGMCALHLVSRGAVAKATAEVNKLQNELTVLTKKNELLEAEINDSIDYEAIRDTAINDYGMMKPEDGQIITYSADDEGYIRQYKDIN